MMEESTERVAKYLFFFLFLPFFSLSDSSPFSLSPSLPPLTFELALVEGNTLTHDMMRKGETEVSRKRLKGAWPEKVRK